MQKQICFQFLSFRHGSIKLQRLKAIIMKGVSETVEQADMVAVKMVEQKQEDLMGRVVCWIV